MLQLQAKLNRGLDCSPRLHVAILVLLHGSIVFKPFFTIVSCTCIVAIATFINFIVFVTLYIIIARLTTEVIL